MVSGKLSPGKLPPVRVRVWFRISVRIRVEGQFSSLAIFLEPFLMGNFSDGLIIRFTIRQ